MISIAARALAATLVALGLASGQVGAAHAARPHDGALQVLHDGHPVRLLAPGASFQVVARGIWGPGGSYCLGLASLKDRYGLPVSLGIFHAGDDGAIVASATVPAHLFPAEPAGPFLLFVGSCTNVAPDGIFGGAVVAITPANG